MKLRSNTKKLSRSYSVMFRKKKNFLLLSLLKLSKCTKLLNMILGRGWRKRHRSLRWFQINNYLYRCSWLRKCCHLKSLIIIIFCLFVFKPTWLVRDLKLQPIKWHNFSRQAWDAGRLKKTCQFVTTMKTKFDQILDAGSLRHPA